MARYKGGGCWYSTEDVLQSPKGLQVTSLSEVTVSEGDYYWNS